MDDICLFPFNDRSKSLNTQPILFHPVETFPGLGKVQFRLVAKVFTARAGLPATTTLGATSPVTTDPAAITEFAPIVTPLRIIEPVQIQTFGLDDPGRRSSRHKSRF